jgi:hypothetical protein
MLVLTDSQFKYCKTQRSVKPLLGSLLKTYELENRDLSTVEMCIFLFHSVISFCGKFGEA